MLKHMLRFSAPLSLLPGLAQAHPGHDLTATFSVGLLHPLTGIDHLLVMFAMGLWAARLSKAWYARATTGYLGLLWVGAGLSQVGALAVLQGGNLELALASSVLVGGGCLVMIRQLHTAVGLSIFSALALLQGYAHGSEMPVQATLGSYLAGLSVCSVAVSVAALFAARWLQRVQLAHTIRWMGGALLVAGATLLVS